MQDPSSIEVLCPRQPEEFEAFAEALHRSLWFPRLADDHWIEREGAERLRVARINGEIVGGLSCHDMGMWFGGRCLSMGAVRAVGVRPDARASGVARAVLRANLVELKEKGIPLASLYPATQRVYKRVGYASAGTMHIYEQPIAELFPISRTSLQPRLLTGSLASKREILAPLYKERARQTPGHLERSDWMWERCLLKPGGKSLRDVYVFEKSGEIEGYLVCDQERNPEQFRGILSIRDWVAKTPEAIQQMWCFVGDHRSHLDTVKWFGPRAEPMLAFLDQHQWEIEESLTWMLRIVDVADALAQRGYPAAVSARVVLQIEDEILPWNQGCWRLEVTNGQAQVQKTSPTSDVISLRVEGLASLFSGYFSPFTLQQMGLLHGSPQACTQLGALFAGGEPWMPDMF
ncbi:MAG: GNAT family N-acetyltransferase [Myxococcales bacterium]|nr:GNAT family N-acetyltransferase [Myxococcales bacterium]